MAASAPPFASRRVGRLGHVVHVAGTTVAALSATSAAFVLGAIARHRIFISRDTMINYAHVWFISRRLWHGDGLPFRMPVVSHGRGFAFPYGLVPWLVASIARPLLGDWTVTLTLIVGAVGLAAATFVAFPELRRGWLAAAVILNPAVVTGVLIGQIPFLWAAALFLLAVAGWRRQRWWWATTLGALAQLTHPAVLIPIAALTVALALRREERPGRLARHYALSLAAAAPAVWLVLVSPVFVESSTAVKVANFVTTIAPRSLAVIVPVLLVALARRYGTRVAFGPLVFLGVVALNVAIWKPLGVPWAWQALSRPQDQAMTRFTSSPEFERGAMYRDLRATGGKLDMYQLLRAGGRLDSEFFPESILRRSWPSAAAYSDFLRERKVDYVMVWRGYARAFHVNEQRVLDAMALAPPGDCTGSTVCVTVVARTPGYTVYGVSR